MEENKLKILVGCEESQEVTKAFRALGYEAYSCDLQECSGGKPEWHLQMCLFEAVEKINPSLLICFPPCTHIARTGGRWFEGKRKDGRQKEALLFFTKIAMLPIKYKAIENPQGILSSKTYIQKWFPEIIDYMKMCGLPRSPDQVIQPYQFGHNKQKETGLWLFNLPKLNYTNIVEPEKPLGYITRKGKYRTGSKRAITWLDNASPKDKAKTFPFIAKAMAEQWSEYLINQP